jgi:hypothetical protein
MRLFGCCFEVGSPSRKTIAQGERDINCAVPAGSAVWVIGERPQAAGSAGRLELEVRDAWTARRFVNLFV